VKIEYQDVDPDDPAVMATADQGLAAMNTRLDALVTTWQFGEKLLGAVEADAMAGVIVPHNDETAVVAMLAIAVDRLAKVHQRPAQPRDDASGGES
jgi:hypothetical protein